jgi:SAM-dependent methyltransferase
VEDWKEVITPRERDNRYEELLAGGAKTRLLESFIDMELAPLLIAKGPLPAGTIAQELSLHPLRTKKWLHLLSLIGLVRVTSPTGRLDYINETYDVTPLAKALFGEDGKGGAFYRDKLQYWRNVAVLDFNEVLKGMPLPLAVRWPPQTFEAASHLEWWMAITASGAIQAVEKAVDLSKIHKILDAGGGNGTIACTMARSHPNLNITVFNLPNSAYLARNNVAQQGLADKVSIYEGDFLSDAPLPGGFDMVLWSRVFTDWPREVVEKLIKKSYNALVPGGRIVICEPLLEGNENFVTAWEFRYIFSDDFGVAVYKPRSVYEQILTETGFKVTAFSDMDEESFYSVITATRP